MPKAQPTAVPGTVPASPWIYGPWLDLIVGCGAWSAPLLAVALWLTSANSRGWIVGFYLLAVVFNYPHFMATIYRAYHTREDFEKYKFFTLHVTLLLALTGILLHTKYRLLPWIFTLYICWSPWHYTGQNYGLLMMFVRRTGASVSAGERRWLRAAFIASYAMLLASFETGHSTDSLILSLGLPANLTLPVRIVCGATFAICAFVGFRRLLKRGGLSAMVAPLTLLLTQFLWFVLPTLLELRSAYQIPQTRYSSGILAVLHSTQYIWITSYYQRREARADGQYGWRMSAYFLTLIAGGIALFIPGPWIVSYLCHFDFTTSFLIFTALVNIHHFILDGAIWKLRDTRISSLLVGGAKSIPRGIVGPEARPAVARVTPNRFLRRLFLTPAFRVSLAVLLFLWSGLDQLHFALGTDEGSLPSLERAASMNPYDSMLQARIATVETQLGQREEAVAALERAVEINPQSTALQHACARAMLEDGRYEEAYEYYQRMLVEFPSDTDAMVNYGLLAARFGHSEDAESAWEKAVAIDPNQTNAQLYMAQALERKGDPAAAVPHWRAFLRLSAAHSDDPAAAPQQQISASIRLGDAEARSGSVAAALLDYQSAVSIAERSGDTRLESIALTHLADLQEKTGDSKAAAISYERSLALDENTHDAQGEAFDWFNYGQFLRRHGTPDELAYACFLRAQNLLGDTGSQDAQTVRAAVRELKARLGNKASESTKDLPGLLARAANLPADSF